MSKVRNLPEALTLTNDDLLYSVLDSAGPNGGRKVKVSTIKTATELTNAEVKTKYEANANTNAFTDAEQTKLAGIETAATADQIASEVPYTNTTSGLSATDVQGAIDELDALVDFGFYVSVATGLIINYTEGKVRFDGIYNSILAGAFLLNANVTDGYVYVDIDAAIKQTASSVLPPAYSVPIAKFTTNATDVLSLTDMRVKIDNNIVRGEAANIASIGADNIAAAGSTYRLADAGHIHAVATAAASSLTANTTNAAGTSNSLSRADHSHAISSAAPSSQSADQANAIGSSASFAKADHTHNIATAAPSNTGTANSQGAALTFAKSDHVHNTIVANSSATASADTTTTSLTDVLIDSMTLTPASGTYLAVFSCSSVNSANGAERCWFSFYVGGVQVSATERSLGTSGGAYNTVALSSIVTASGAEAVEVRWRVAAGTQTSRSRRLSLIRLG